VSDSTTPAEDQDWSPAEYALLDAALEFYGAADDVIDYGGDDRPRLRRDAPGFQAVRASMSLLEERIRTAHSAGVTHEQISRITRLEPDIVSLILARGDDQPTTT
jgi:hypothetical protein